MRLCFLSYVKNQNFSTYLSLILTQCFMEVPRHFIISKLYYPLPELVAVKPIFQSIESPKLALQLQIYRLRLLNLPGKGSISVISALISSSTVANDLLDDSLTSATTRSSCSDSLYKIDK